MTGIADAKAMINAPNAPDMHTDFLFERYRRARAQHFMVAGFGIIARGKMLSDDKIRTECVAFSVNTCTRPYVRERLRYTQTRGWVIMLIQKGASCSSRSKLN